MGKRFNALSETPLPVAFILWVDRYGEVGPEGAWWGQECKGHALVLRILHGRRNGVVIARSAERQACSSVRSADVKTQNTPQRPALHMSRRRAGRQERGNPCSKTSANPDMSDCESDETTGAARILWGTFSVGTWMCTLLIVTVLVSYTMCHM